ncbi:glutamate--tRNA ligase family protein, partial [Acinetobacter baumannii]
NNGDFIVRIEDTDQTRFVAGAEQYIFRCLEWCGLTPNESPLHGGPYGPYRQSERKANYRKYAEELIAKGYAYYAFDTAEALEAKRNEI